ncbi:pyrroline-5-carboxylate reductase [Aeribacillus pallidus]|uniref:pyrroline-5-carboxylate reductase n=1 Tax=Aeribacillus pallidus TaxID=33936 RepID=UPI003D255282
MKRIAFIGAGSMAEAMIAGMVKTGLVESKNIIVTNKHDEQKLQRLAHTYGVRITYNREELFKDTDIIVLAMKPKDIKSAISDIRDYLKKHHLLVSVLAGVSLQTLEEGVGKQIPIVRAMPNTSATIQKSATAISFNRWVSEKQKQIAHELFAAIGLVTEVAEEQLDAVTGLSGSGPAYIYYIVEAMEESAEQIGLEKDKAKQLIVQTLIGAAEMLSMSEKQPSELREAVTSPGGTTEAGIRMLDQRKVKEALIDCIQAATKQSKTLGERLRVL